MTGIAHESHELVPRGEALVVEQSSQIGEESHAGESLLAQGSIAQIDPVEDGMQGKGKQDQGGQ